MSIEKSELKAAFAHSLGCDSDDDLEAAKRDIMRATGRVQASRMMEAEVTKVIEKLKLDMDSEEPPFRAPEDYQKAMFYLGACLAKAATMAKQSDNLRLQMEGKVMAFEHTIKRLSKIKEAEERKTQVIKTASEAPAGSTRGSRPTGVHPGESIATQRKAESAEQKVAKKKKKKTRKKRTKKTSTKNKNEKVD